MTIRYSDIKRFAVHDGPGIRTTLFLSGCPLRCLWCHNPESMSATPRVAVYAQRCLMCGTCVKVCPTGAHIMYPRHYVSSACSGCGACIQACPADALRLYGKHISIEKAFELLTEDRAFYHPGGITLSGGEPLIQPEACGALLQRVKAEGIHTAVDTCGAVDWEAFEKVIEYTDLFLYDLKHMNNAEHKRLTGSGNTQIIENLKRLASHGADIEIRMPIIPRMNDSDEELREAGAFLKTIGIEKVTLLPYHMFAISKYESLHMNYAMSADIVPPTDDEMRGCLSIIRKYLPRAKYSTKEKGT